MNVDAVSDLAPTKRITDDIYALSAMIVSLHTTNTMKSYHFQTYRGDPSDGEYTTYVRVNDTWLRIIDQHVETLTTKKAPLDCVCCVRCVQNINQNCFVD